jgi:uncharacterized protein YgbK (DUF1537 family)
VWVVLDDDPTGTQCVNGVPVITAWQPADVEWALTQLERDAAPAGFFILTNTRALAPAAAAERLTVIADTVESVAAAHGIRVEFVLRGDSTLRGHYPLESDVLEARAREAGRPYAALLLVPAYLEAGRVTDGDVHWVVRDGVRMPAGDTDYARDATFGYRASNLRDWVAEKTGGRIPAGRVLSIGPGADAAAVLEACTPDERGAAQPVVVNATTAVDLTAVADAVRHAAARGIRTLIRTGPSFVPALLGVAPRAPLTRPEVVGASAVGAPGLVVVGSHVELTSRQLARLQQRRPGIRTVELDVPALLADPDAETLRAETALIAALDDGTAVFATSRTRVSVDDPAESLAIAARVSRALVGVTARVAASRPLAWVIAKGGITSSDVATDALGIRRATVLGQLFPGTVSVWAAEPAGAVPVNAAPINAAPINYVVFAGNVGDDESLADAVDILSPSP